MRAVRTPPPTAGRGGAAPLPDGAFRLRPTSPRFAGRGAEPGGAHCTKASEAKGTSSRPCRALLCLLRPLLLVLLLVLARVLEEGAHHLDQLGGDEGLGHEAGSAVQGV